MSGLESVEAPVAPQPQDGKITLAISPDRMEVRAMITPPLHGWAPVTAPQVLAELAKAKVVFGIDPEAAERLAVAAAEGAGGIQGAPVEVARGRAPVRGADAVITYHDLLQTPSGYPQEREDGTVDFFEMNMVRNVLAGVPLVTRTPPTKGQPGMDVMGKSLAALDGRDLKLRAGKGTKISPDGLSVLSAIEGHAALNTADEVSVSPVFTVAGDVDFGTGNIDFVGTVIVRGDIGAGFTVKAAQNLEVHGGIMGGTVEVGGDVIVRYGIVGGGRGRVTAGGKVQCRFVEAAEIWAGGDLTVVEGILNAQVFSGGRVLVTGARGSIIGGLVRARYEISAKVIGSNVGAPTEVQVGMAPQTAAVRDQVRNQLHQVEERLTRASQTASFLRELEAGRPEAFTETHRRSLQQATRSQHQYRAEREQLLARLEQLEAEHEEAKSARIRAFEVVYPGVRIVIGTERYLVLDLCHRCSFYLSGEGAVAMAPA